MCTVIFVQYNLVELPDILPLVLPRQTILIENFVQKRPKLPKTSPLKQKHR